eukprot:TRINITY_DN8251_c0_g2_i1.p1 TRINITY_DN8251_c0_g2~~TRINITY_DN8251_c0_g2_i1.p1  ORF type:complete len:251 (+),score=81.19 TRINITY_DN8251_c0_g2_i1:861-1613(+)
MQEDKRRCVFEKIMSFLTTEHENLAKSKSRRELDFEAVAKMFTRRLQSSLKPDASPDDQLRDYLASTEELLKTSPSTACKSESEEDEFTIYKEKEKGPKTIHRNINPVKVVEERKVLKKKVEKTIVVEDNYTLADLIPIKPSEKRAKKEKKPISIKASAQPWPVKEDACHKLSIDEIIKQEQEQKELDLILKQIEYQENLEKAIELSKQEYEQSQSKAEEEECYSYNRGYQRQRGRRCGRQVRYRRRYYS